MSFEIKNSSNNGNTKTNDLDLVQLSILLKNIEKNAAAKVVEAESKANEIVEAAKQSAQEIMELAQSERARQKSDFQKEIISALNLLHTSNDAVGDTPAKRQEKLLMLLYGTEEPRSRMMNDPRKFSEDAESGKEDFGAIVKLNVGGNLFTTSLATLKKKPDSMLAAMFSGRFSLPLDAQGLTKFLSGNR